MKLLTKGFGFSLSAGDFSIFNGGGSTFYDFLLTLRVAMPTLLNYYFC